MVFRHIYGASFGAPALVEPLKDLSMNRQASLWDVSHLIDRVRLFCTFYDPKRDRYRLDYSLLIALVVGGVSLTGIGFVIVRAWLRSGSPSGQT